MILESIFLGEMIDEETLTAGELYLYSSTTSDTVSVEMLGIHGLV